MLGGRRNALVGTETFLIVWILTPVLVFPDLKHLFLFDFRFICRGCFCSERIKICRKLRDAGIAADFYYGSKAKLGKQMTCANEQGVPLAVIFGEDELRTGIVKLRKFKYGESDEASTGKEAEVR